MDFDFLCHFFALVLLHQKRLGNYLAGEEIGAAARAVSPELEAFCKASFPKKFSSKFVFRIGFAVESVKGRELLIRLVSIKAARGCNGITLELSSIKKEKMGMITFDGDEVIHIGNYRRKGSKEFMKGLPFGVSADDPDIIEDHFQNKLAAANFCSMTEDYEKAAKYARQV